MERTYTVWISRASDPGEFFQVGNDILSFSGLDWTVSMNLFKLALSEGYTLILAREDQEAGGEDAEEEKC